MSFNGNGVFLVNSTGQPVVAGTTISDTVFNAFTSDIATGLSNCITKDGQQTVTANIPMAGFKFTGLGYGTANTDSARVDNANLLSMCEGRLTLTTATPITTSDVTAATTVYFTPYRGNRIALYDGTNWVMRSFSEISFAVPATTNTNYDVFAYDNSGTVTLEQVAWTNDTTRATALTTLNGVYVKSGATTRRYLGSFRTTTVSGQCEDSVTKRYVWNYYNRVRRPMRKLIAGTYAYTSATVRQANADTTAQLDFVIGLDEEAFVVDVTGTSYNSVGGSVTGVGQYIGLDSTTAIATGSIYSSVNGSNVPASTQVPLRATYTGFIGAVGKHNFVWLESGAANNSFGNAVGANSPGITTSING